MASEKEIEAAAKAIHGLYLYKSWQYYMPDAKAALEAAEAIRNKEI